MTNKLTPNPIPRTQYSRHEAENAAYQRVLDQLDRVNEFLSEYPLGTGIVASGHSFFLMETEHGLTQMKFPGVAKADEGIWGSDVSEAEWIEGIGKVELDEIVATIQHSLRNPSEHLVTFNYKQTVAEYQDYQLRSQRPSIG